MEKPIKGFRIELKGVYREGKEEEVVVEGEQSEEKGGRGRGGDKREGRIQRALWKWLTQRNGRAAF